MSNLDDLYKYIVTYKTEHDGNSPKYDQIKEDCGISSTSVVRDRLVRLERQGKITLLRKDGGHVQGIAVKGGRWTLG
jgi:DNA-binding FadR family transcriptional regulator